MSSYLFELIPWVCCSASSTGGAEVEVITVVIVEDDVLASMALRQLLEGEGLRVRTFASTDSAYAECSVSPPDVLIADWCVPGDITTPQLVEHLHRINPSLRVIFTSGYEPDELRGLTTGERWMSYMSKPIPFDRIVENIREMRIRGERPRVQ